MPNTFTRRDLLKRLALGSVGIGLAACQPKVVEVEKVVKETVIVEGKPQVVEKIVEKEVEKEVTRIIEKEAQSAGGESINMVWLHNCRPARCALYEGVAREFENEHPGVLVNFIGLGWGQYLDKLQVMFAGGAQLDMANVAGWHYRKFGLQGLLTDLEPYISAGKLPYANRLVEGWLDSLRLAGTLYCYNTDQNCMVLQCNKDMFAEAGVDLPPSEWDDPDWTYETMFEMASKFRKEEGGKRLTFGLQPPGNWLGAQYPWIYSYGGRWWTPDYSAWALTSEASLKAIQDMTDIIHKMEVSPSPEQQQAGFAGWTAGNVAMTYTWSSEAFNMGWWDLEWDWDHYPLPRGPEGNYVGPMNAPSGRVIPSSSKYKDLAWDLIAYFHSEERVEWEARNGWTVPPIEDLKPLWMADRPEVENKAPGLHGVDRRHEEMAERPDNFRDMQQVYTSQCDYIWNNEKTAQEALTEIEGEMNALLAEANLDV